MSHFENIQIVQQPAKLNINLYQHQLASIYNMEKLEIENIIDMGGNKFKKTKIGINADMVGFGKTLSMIGLIIRDKLDWDITIPHVVEKMKIEAEGLVVSYEILRYTRLPTTLVLVPQTIISQWVQEIERSELTYTCVTTKQELLNLHAENYDIILVIPNMYNKIVSTYSNCCWKRFIFDEPGTIKVAGMTHVRAGFYWFLTATPTDIFHHHYRCNRGTFMRDIIGQSFTDFENLLPIITIQNNSDFIKASFEMPKTFHYYYECQQPIFNVIHSFINTNIKSMIDSGNIEGAIIALGGKKTDNIVDIILEKKRKEISELDIKKQLYELNGEAKKIEETQDRKITLLNQITELELKFNNMLHETCNICYEPLKKPVIEINCQNVFCGECLLTWLRNKNSCPLCRSEINKKDLIYIQTKNDIDNTLLEIKPKLMNKLDQIIDIIKKNKNGKFLIFSDHDGSFNSINSILKDNNIDCIQIRGNVKTIEKNLSSFKSGGINVIFLNSKYCGSGINLQEATDIILYHEMHFGSETQIIGRANRIGRKDVLNVHHLKLKTSGF